MKLKEPIELCEEGPCSPMPQASDKATGIYVRLPDIAELGGLPLSGEITFCFERKSVSLDGADDLSAQLMLTKITAVKADVSEDEDAPKDDVVDKLFDEANAAETKEGDEE